MDLTNVFKSETIYGATPTTSDPPCIAFGVDANFIHADTLMTTMRRRPAVDS